MPLAGVPERIPVPFPPWKRTPVGSAPRSETLGAGLPLAATMNAVASPTTNVALLADLNVGTAPTTSVNVWLELSAVPWPAVRMIL